jgi:hypothetical protein
MPGSRSRPYGHSGRFAATGGAVPGLLPAEPAALLPVDPLVDPLIDPPAAPVVLPEGALGLAAVFNRACPVVLSLQCVAAEMSPPPEGDGVDCAAAPITLAPRNAAESRRVLYIGSLPRSPPCIDSTGAPRLSNELSFLSHPERDRQYRVPRGLLDAPCPSGR